VDYVSAASSAVTVTLPSHLTRSSATIVLLLVLLLAAARAAADHADAHSH